MIISICPSVHVIIASLFLFEYRITRAKFTCMQIKLFPSIVSHQWIQLELVVFLQGDRKSLLLRRKIEYNG